MTCIRTVLCCWLHMSYPQAAIRGQKGEKGEPAVLEPVSLQLSLSSLPVHLYLGWCTL